MRPGQCGWRREGGRVSLELYMQYDPHVQQVIDERLVLECDMASRTGTVRDIGLGSLEAVHSVQDTASIPLTASIGGPGSSWATEEEEDILEEDIEDIVVDKTVLRDIEIDSNQILELENEEQRFDGTRRRRLDDLEAGGMVTGWLDISQDGGRIQDPLEEGQVVRLSAKVQQVPGEQDTLVTRCMMASGAGHLIQLTDEFGCSLDRGLVSDFRYCCH